MSRALFRILRHLCPREPKQGQQGAISARLAFRHCDLELLEDRLAPAVFNVNSLADILSPPSSTVTLRSAIQAANATPGNNTINLTIPGTYKITLSGSGEDKNATGDFDIIPNSASPPGSSLTIVNTSGQAVTVDGNHLDRVFDINPADASVPANFTVIFGGPQVAQGFTITGGMTPVAEFNLGGGGGIEDQGNVNLTFGNMVVTGNFANDDGGGIAMWDFADASWTLTLNSSTISNNSVNDAGGGVFSNGTGKILITAGTVITGNLAYNQGGGIWLDSIGQDSANLTMDGTLVSNNTAFSTTGLGGGIGNDGNGAVVITNSTLQSNSAGLVGGGYGEIRGFGSLSLAGSVVSTNTATGNGGGIAVAGPTTSITNCEIDGNTSHSSGGGIFANGTTLAIQSSTCANDLASGNGGGIEMDTTAGNSTVTDATIAGNRASGSGGGIDAGSSFVGGLRLLNVTVNANSGATGGGVFWASTSGSSFSLENTILARNSASSGPDAFAQAAFSDLGGNLVGVSGSGSGNSGFSAISTQAGTVGNPLNPLLGPLANNGGPTIGASGQTLTLLTEALLTGSPAIGKGILSGAPATDERGSSSVTNGKINVGAVSLMPAAAATVTGQSIVATEGQSFSGQVALFQDPGVNDTFTASIDWGDKTVPTLGSVIGSNGSYTISGSHTYTDEGQDTITVQVARLVSPTSSIATGTGTAKVAEGDNLAGNTLTTVNAAVGQAFSGAVASFTDAYKGSPAKDYSATIAWGDNTSSPGVVSGSNGLFTVAGSHTYGYTGSFRLSVTLAESMPGSAAATATGDLTVSTLMPRPAIQNVFNIVTALKAGATNSQDTALLASVLNQLNTVLVSAVWIDDYHLQPGNGSIVFDSVNNSVTELFGMYQNPGSLVPKSTLLSIVNQLAQATEQLASIAITDAIVRHGNVGEIILAKQEFVHGYLDLNASNFNTVVGHFKNAWTDAQLAVPS